MTTRLEIEAALTRNVRVIPILVEGARVPRAEKLPPSLAKLVHRQALELSPSCFDFDTGQLLKVLDRTLANVHPQPAVTEPAPPPAVAHEPAGSMSAADQGKPRGSRRQRLLTRGGIFALVGTGVVIVSVLLAVLPSNSPTAPSPVAPSSATTTSPTGGVVFQDDFSRQVAGWPDVRSSGDSGHYTGSAYRMHAEPVPGGGGSLGVAPLKASNVYPSAPPNIRIGIDGRMVSGSNQNAGYGMFCRGSEQQAGVSGLLHPGNAYTFTVWDNHVAIAELLAEPPYYKELGDAGMSAVHANATNRLQAECANIDGQQSLRLRFWVNGQVVIDITDHDPLSTGTAGLVVALGDAKQAVEAEFDNFVVTPD